MTAATSADELPEPELVIVATKTTGLEGATRSFAGHWPAATVMTVPLAVLDPRLAGRQ